PMASFKKFYRTIYKTFGYPLKERVGITPRVIAKEEKRLGVRIPAALRDFYLVAGRDQRFTECHQRLLAPYAWEIDKHRLIFMEENQSVCWWGVSIRNSKTDDPPISQGISGDVITWVREQRRCSEFVAGVLHYHAVIGGLPFLGQGDA